MTTRQSRGSLPRLLSFALMLAASTAALSCGDSTGPQFGTAASLQIVAGQDQSFTVAHELPQALRVRVTDDQGRPVEGQLVNFRVTSGGGNMFAGSALTNSDGQAADRWTLGTTAGPQSVEARAVDAATGAPLVFGNFHATAVADVPAAVTKVSGDGQSGTAGVALPTPLAVKVADAYGNPVSNASVTFTPGNGSGVVAPSPAATDASGVARTTWTLGQTSGAQQVTPSVGALAAPAFTATAAAGAASTLVLATPAAGAASNVAFTTQPVIRIADAFGNLVASSTAAVTMSVSSGASVLGTATVAAVNGVATFSNVGLSGPAGSYTLTYASTLGSTNATISQPITLTVGAPAKLTFATQSPATAQAGIAFTSAPVVQVSDANGAPVGQAGVSVALTVTSGPGAVLAGTTTATTDANGRAAFPGVHLDGAAGSYSLSATASGLASAQSHAIVLGAGPEARLGFVQQPTGAARLAVIAPTVKVAVQDQFGNTVVDATGPISLSLVTNPNGAAFTGGDPATPVNGVASFPAAMLDRAGTGYALQATHGSSSATSATFDSSPVATVAVRPSNLSSGNMLVTRLSISGGNLYYQVASDDITSWVFSVPTTGGASVQRTDGFNTNGYRFGSLVSDANGPYFMYRPSSANTQPCYVTGVPTINPLARFCVGRAAADGGFVYVTSDPSPSEPLNSIYFNGAISRISIADGTRTILQKSSTTPMFTLSNGVLFYADLASNVIKRVPVAGGTPTNVTSIVRSVSELAVANDVLYWLEAAADGTTSLMSVPASGGTPTVRAAGLLGYTHSLVTDGGVLYLIHNDVIQLSSPGGTLLRFRVADFSSILVSTQVSDVALDDLSVYWSSRANASSIKKAAK